MTARSGTWARWCAYGGLALMLLGLVDPLEGSLLVAPGSGLVAASALLTRSVLRRRLFIAFGLVVTGVAILWIMSAFGGVGGSTGRSMWWLLLVLPYPVGALMSLFGAARKIKEGFATPSPPGGSPAA